MSGPALATKRVKLDALHEDPGNVRRHGAKNLDAIRNSLKAFGQVEPLVVQSSTGRVIGGNGRLSVMRQLRWQECDVVEIDVDDQAADRIAIALNRSGELAEWDAEGLGRMLSSIKDGADLGACGFDVQDLNELMDSLRDGEEEPRELAIQPPPRRVWALIAVPIGRWPDIAAQVQAISQVDGAIVETTVES